VSPLLTVNLVYAAILGAAALRWGDAPERSCAATLFAMTYGDAAYHALLGQGPVYGVVDVWHLALDLGVAAVFIGIALQANRIYPLWLAAFQLVSVFSHFAREETETFPKLAYGLMTYVPYYVVLLIAAAGLWRHALRRSRHGPYRSWRNSSHPSPDGKRPSPPIG
jgi:hypothetical protein